MLPISGQFYHVLILCGCFAGSALLFLAAPRHRLLAAVPPAVLAVVAVWQVANTGDEEYAAIGPMIVIFSLGLTIGAAAIWMLFARLIIKSIAGRMGGSLAGKAMLALSVLTATAPALVVAGVFAERQFVPVSVCSTANAVFIVGDSRYRVPAEFGAMIEKERWLLKGRWRQFYSTDPARKEDLKWICAASENGAADVKVDALGLNIYCIGAVLEETCRTEQGRTRAYCSGYRPKMLETVRSIDFTDQPEQLRPNNKNWFRSTRPEVTKGGDLTDGFLCIADDYDTSVQCSSWRPVDAETSIYAQSQRSPGKTADEQLRSLNEAIAFFQRVLAP